MPRLIPALVLGSLAFALVGAQASVQEAFLASDAAQRLDGLETEFLFAVPFEGDDVLVAYYIPFHSALSDWDEETRFSLYRRKGDRQFERSQFVTKAGDSVPGKVAGWLATDIDGDGLKEVVLVSPPTPPADRVKTMVLRRSGAKEKFSIIWKRQDRGAALRVADGRLFYTHDPRTGERQFERHALVSGQFVREAGPTGETSPWTKTP